MTTYRLLKVVCQAVLVSEDGDGNLIEHPTEPVPVPAAAWLSYPDRLTAQIANLNNGREVSL